MKRVNGVAPKAFVPFTLLIETEDEARLLGGLVSAVSNNASRAIGVKDDRTAMRVYELLSDYNVKPYAITIQPKE